MINNNNPDIFLALLTDGRWHMIDENGNDLGGYSRRRDALRGRRRRFGF